ncbi:PPR repeat [Musa troglodytarum]|uniref:PPR repeat n=1 Tax=Musa troglodytarum TaxID=320322 RepID=A0A9E7L0F8_9LILI|nr:PPR repeat [Musa troglodytarum]
MTTVSSAPVRPLLLPAPSPRAHTSSTLPRNARHDRSIPSSSSLILDKTMRGEFPQSFQLFRELLASGWTPDEFALGSLLKASSTLSGCCLGEQLHAKSIRAGLASERGVRTSLVAMYSANGLLEEARHVFDEVPVAEEADVPTWNSVISGYAFHGYYDECFLLFGAMLGAAELTATDATYAIVISACSASKEVRIGKAIHAMIEKDQMLDEIKMHNSLISMYAKWGHLEEAQKVFEAMDARDVVS